MAAPYPSSTPFGFSKRAILGTLEQADLLANYKRLKRLRKARRQLLAADLSPALEVVASTVVR